MRDRSGNSLSRRGFLVGVGAAGLAGCTEQESAAGGCPGVAGERIRWIVPYTPGGGYDLYSRILEGPFEERLAAEITLTHEPGGGGLLGATQLRDAPADGRTLGILNATGLIFGALVPAATVPSPIRDFSVIGRLESRVRVMCTGAISGLRTIEDVLELQRQRPVLTSTTGIISSDVASDAIASELLGLDLQFISGYPGGQEKLLAALRGEVDLVCGTYESLQDNVESGELRVLMQISDSRISPHPALDGVDWLCGPEGWAVQHAMAEGRDPEQAQTDADNLAELYQAGTIVAGPPGMDPELLNCLESRFLDAAQSPEMLAAAEAARRSLDVAGRQAALQRLRDAEATANRYAARVQQVMEKIRQGGAA